MEKEILTIHEDDHLDVADGVMRFSRVRHIPVVSDGEVVGIVSQRDLFRAGISSVLAFRGKAEREWLAKISIDEVMTAPVFTIGPDESVQSAVAIMLNKRIGCLPVVEGGKLVGILSESDCLRCLARLLEIGEAREGLSELPKGM
ncbi:MAG TPA: CBS domain-containing protein [Candidatus Binatia bacterium]